MPEHHTFLFSIAESTIMALASNIKSIHNMNQIVLQLLKKAVPTVCYVDNQTIYKTL